MIRRRWLLPFGAFRLMAWAADPPDLFLGNLADFVWTGAGGNSTWENSPNWTAPTFPRWLPVHDSDFSE